MEGRWILELVKLGPKAHKEVWMFEALETQSFWENKIFLLIG